MLKVSIEIIFTFLSFTFLTTLNFKVIFCFLQYIFDWIWWMVMLYKLLQKNDSRNRQFIVQVCFVQGKVLHRMHSIYYWDDWSSAWKTKISKIFHAIVNFILFLFLQSYTTRESRRLFGKHRSLSSEWCHPFPRLCHVLCAILLRLRWSGTALPRFVVADIFSPKGVVNSHNRLTSDDLILRKPEGH